MGLWQSTQRGSEEIEDVSTTSQYRYPPKTGNFFSTHFIMGGEKFDSPQPESFLFGENSDLNFLGSKPVPFPYPPPQANEPTKTLKALINIRRDSLHFVKVKTEDGQENPGKYNIVFTLDSDVKTSITIYYLATEEMNGQSVVYSPKFENLCSPSYIYRKGADQAFSQPDHVFQPGMYENMGLDNMFGDVLPVVIHCLAEEGEEPRQSHVTIGVIEKHSDGIYALKTLKQKLFVDGLCYLIQEIYGVERKGLDEVVDEELDDTGAECVVCMCDSRDTLILPCRHLCLCNACADSLRYQANNCPICRAPFRALLQIRALQKTGHSATHPALAAEAQTEGVPPGYEPVSLVEALNGPFAPPPPPPLTLTEGEGKKKKSKRRGSKDHHGNKEGKRSVGEKSLSPPPVEEVDSENLPPPPSPPPSGASHPSSAGDVTIIDEKGRRNSVKSVRKSKNLDKIVTDDQHKIKLEIVSQSSLGDSELVEEELARIKELEESAVTIQPETHEEPDDEDTKEPTTEDELLRDEKQESAYQPALTDVLYDPSLEDVLYEPKYSAAEYSGGSDQEDDDENVEVVSLRMTSERVTAPSTPSSSTSIRSSQESATSVNSSKQLLDKQEECKDESEAKKKEEKRKRGKSSIAPEPREE